MPRSATSRDSLSGACHARATQVRDGSIASKEARKEAGMSDTPDDAPDESGAEQRRPAPRQYGADWIGIDVPALRERREVQAERERQAMEQEQERLAREEAWVRDLLDEDASSGSSDTARQPITATDSPKKQAEARPRPEALIRSLHVENLRSLAGEHEIELAPLTLIYGPNAAGKSTVLFALKTLMGVVHAGRFDAIHAWRNAFPNSSITAAITYDEPDPEDPSGHSWRSPLVLGADFVSRDKKLARVRLTYDVNPVGPFDPHTTEIGRLDESQLARKEFAPEDFEGSIEPPHAGDFGTSALPSFRITESRPGQARAEAVRAIDAELFSHSDGRLLADLFELAYHLKHFGPHRGDPGREYNPVGGDFNSSWYDGYRKPRLGGFDEFEILNQMLAQLEIPYEFELDPLAKIRKTNDRGWRLRDTRSGAPVALNQVGYGVSQLLPVIDVCVHASKQLVLIEEPELHLHPRLQAKLGNLFATSVARFGNQVILETHSENILLRVRRLIRGGKLRSDEVAVLYVDNTAESGATVRRLRLGPEGELLDPWPTGFFDDGLADILGITE